MVDLYSPDISLSLPSLYPTDDTHALFKQEKKFYQNKEVSQNIDEIVHDLYKLIQSSATLDLKIQPDNREAFLQFAKSVQKFSQDQLKQNQTEKWKPIRDFFAKLINLFKMKMFASSAEIGIHLADRLMSQYYIQGLHPQKIKPEESQQKEKISTPTGEEIAEKTDEGLETKSAKNFSQSIESTQEEEDDIDESQLQFFDADSFDEDILEDILVKDSDFADADEWKEQDQMEQTELPIQQQNSDNPDSIKLQQQENKSSATEEHIQSMLSTPPPITPAPQVERQKIVEVQQTKTRPVSPRSAMLDTFISIWKHASPKARGWIQLIWNTMLKEAAIKEWTQTGNSQVCELKLGKELAGEQRGIPGKAILMQNMKLTFTEEKMPNLIPDQYRQIIDFPKGGIAQRLGEGFFSTDIHLKRIIVEHTSTAAEPTCKIEFTKFGLTQTMAFSATHAHDFWSKVQWKD